MRQPGVPFLIGCWHYSLPAGDTVNTASRMESNSVKNRINISAEAAEVLKAQAPDVVLRSRGEVAIKGKGEMHLYWVEEAPKEQLWRLSSSAGRPANRQ